MSSNLRVNNILPSVGTNVAIGTAGGSVTLTGNVTTNITGGTISGVSTAGITTAYINTLSGISTIDASAAVSINQNLVFASGKGIDFSAGINTTTMTSELLSDYEEGTWTPRISGTTGGNYTPGSGNSGWYTKIGRIVTASATIEWTAAVTPYSGLAIVAGLPYVALNSSNYRAAAIVPGQAVGIYASGSYVTLKAGMDANNSFVYIVMVAETISAGTNYSHTPNVLSTGAIYGFTVTYITN